MSRDIYAYPSGMDDPYRMEAFKVEELNQEATSFFSFQQGARAAALYCGSSNPNETAIQGPVGSLYTRDDGGVGSLWIKTGTDSDSWSQLQTTDVKLDDAYAGGVVVSTGIHKKNPDLETALDQFRETCSQYEELRTNLWDCPPEEHNRRRDQMAELVFAEMACLAPMLTVNFANAMCILGQEGEDVVAFISSVRDFADVLSWSNDEFGLERSAEDFEKVSLFGIPFVKSAKIPAGYAGAVSNTGQIVLMTITR